MSSPKSSELLAAFLERPDRSALMLDVDGTLAPIVLRPELAAVPEPARALLRKLESRYALVACVTGRRAEEARRIVGIESLTYVGNHGLELLVNGELQARSDPSLPELAARVRAFAQSSYGDGLASLGVRLEDKEAISAFHWRGAPDEQAARQALERVANQAEQEGLAPRWGRKVLEIRPSIPVDKGTAVETALAVSADADRPIDQALYAGDDTTDLDAFRKLRELEGASGVHAVCVGVVSSEAPPAIARDADLVVDGPEGLLELLGELAR